MKSALLLFTILFWLCHLQLDVSLFFLLMIAAAGYFWIRFRKPVLALILVLICTFRALSLPDPGQEYTRIEKNLAETAFLVTEIHQGYKIAAHGSLEIVVYDEENKLGIHDLLTVDELDEIYSLNNFHLYSFASAMKNRRIIHSTNNYQKIGQGSTPAAKIYRFLLQDPDLAVCGMLAGYGIFPDQKPSWAASLGLPFMGLVSLLRALLHRRVSRNILDFLIACFCFVWGSLFAWPPALIRVMVFLVVNSCFKDRKIAWSLSVLGYLVLVPAYAFELCFLFPAFLSFGSLWNREVRGKRVVSYVMSAWMQIFLFSRISFLSLFAFSFLRKIWGIIMILAWSAVLFSSSKLAAFVEGILQAEVNLDGLVFDGAANWIAVAGFSIFIWSFLLDEKTRRRRQRVWQTGLLSLVIYWLSFSCNPFFQVSVLDIGQGDCTLITEPFCKSAVLIDAAGNLYRDNAEKIILPYLKSRRIQTLDAIVVTHADFDHSGAVESLVESDEITVLRLVDSRMQEVPVDYPMLSLLPERIIEGAGNENDESIVSYFVYDGFRYLWMADASIAIEKQILETMDPKTDILKLGHHGSNTSSSLEFLQESNPMISIVSAGRNNRYHHPHPDVVSRVDFAGSDLLRTDQDGMICFSSLPGLLITHTASGFWSIHIQSP